MINQANITTRAAMLLGCFILMATNISAQVKGVEGKDGKWGLVNSAGKMITPYSYQLMGNNGVFTEGLVAVVQNKKSGYIDTTGKVIIPLKYDECNVFKFGTATVWLGDFCGLIDKKGKLLIPIKFSLIEDAWDDDKVAVSLYNKATEQVKYGLFNRSGKQLLPVTYNEISDMQDLVPVKTKPVQKPAPSVLSDVVPGVFTMQVPTTLKQQSGDLYGHVSIYSDGYTFLYFKKDDNKNAISFLDAMLQFKQSKTKAGFSEIGSINEISTTDEISFMGFFGLQPNPLKNSENTEEAYVYFIKPGDRKNYWVMHYKLGKDNPAQIEKDIETFLKTVQLK